MECTCYIGETESLGNPVLRFCPLHAAAHDLYAALDGIISIGKRDMSNPKYDGYFRTAKEALKQARR
jgi:hypothetical protein